MKNVCYFSDWYKPSDLNVETRQCFMPLEVIIKNGRKLFVLIQSTILIKPEETDKTNIRNVRMKTARLVCMDLAEGLLGRRIGLPGYHGYFYIKSIKNIKK